MELNQLLLGTLSTQHKVLGNLTGAALALEIAAL